MDLATELRTAFDRTFAEPPAERGEAGLDFLALRVAGKPYAVALSHVTSLLADETVTRLPARAGGFLGVAWLRGEVVPVYCLPSLLGEAADSDRQRWLIVAGHGRAAAFAFEAFEGQFRIARDRIVPAKSAQGPIKARIIEETPRPIIDLPSLLGAIERLADKDTRPKEN